MAPSYEYLKNIDNEPDRRRFAADENSRLLENGSESANYDDNCAMNSGQPRNVLKSFTRSACELVPEWNEIIFGRCFLHVCAVVKLTILSNYANFLLVLVPLAIMAGQLNSWSPVAIFALNLIAVAPLATTLEFAIEQMSMSLNDGLGNLLMATSGNVVEIIIGIIALKDGQIEVVQSTVLGSILLNLLLVTGSSFFLGGIFNMCDQNGEGVEQNFASATAQTTRSFMTMSLACLVIPASLYAALSKADSDDKEHSILLLSRGTAIILLLLYSLYLLFQLHTHPDLFSTQIPYEENTDDQPIMNLYTAAFIVAFTTYLITVCASYFVGCIGNVVDTIHVNGNFIGIAFIPAVSNAAEHLMAIHMAIRNKMDLTIGIAAGSCIQVSLFTTPVLVILGWAVLDKPMTLRFEMFQTMALVFAVLVAYTAQDGKSNYLHGAMLIGLYSIITLALYVSPSDALDKAFCISNA
ncbi:Vacuolar calcium ion transporter [Colletotrichum siamense]|uniref:Vacuolar calcium ion transporter n=1 Tax=Colletotrichum siamense TaxID=690259 RepID=UPI00187296C6|nr:Vacuolar calcium ion transporter [Colletotrichum siamense]KAF5485199.1 Vacuolar calcium ion transporter [Colletotrichum siamense]